MKILFLLGILLVANVSAQFDFDDIRTNPEIEEEVEYGFPLPLMWFDEKNHSIVVDYEKISSLFNNSEVAERKIVAVSVIGALRKGKSFFMSYCLRYMYANYKSVNFMDNPLSNKENWIGDPEAPLKGFAFKGGADRHTTGVIMWSDIFLHEKKNGNKTEKYAIILFDTQGLFDQKTSPADNTRIFALGTLISSLQIFNLKDVIQEDQLDYLRTATDYAKFHADATPGKAVKPFQKLLFLVRDWAHIGDYSFGKIGGSGYVQSILSSTQTQNPALKSVRKYIEKSFDEVLGWLLPYPGKKVTENGYDGRNSAMEEDFKLHLMSLIEWLFNSDKLIKKRVLDNEVVGSEYGEFISTYFKIFQSPNNPDIPSVYEATVERQLGNYLNQAMKYYVAGLNNHTNYNETLFPEYLDKVHEFAENLTFTWFKAQKKMGMKNDEDQFVERLKKEMKEYYIGWKKASVETWNEMQRTKKENEEKVEAIRVENERKLAEQAKAREEHELEMNRNYTESMNAINAQNNLTLFQKAQQLQALAEAKERNEASFNKTLLDTVNKLNEEAKSAKIAAEEKFKEEKKKLEENGSGKNSMIFKAIEESRKTFLDMFEMQNKNQIEERKNLEKRWEREDARRKEEMEQLRLLNENEAKLRREEMDRQDRIRKEEREEDRRRYDEQQKERRQEQQEAKVERLEYKKQMDAQMAQMREMSLRRNKASSVSSPGSFATLLSVAVFLLVLTFNKKV